MKILIDGDACSVIDKAEKIANQNKIECHIFCDTKHIITSDYSEIHIVDAGHDAADFAIVNRCENNDIVITNDGGLAAMILAKNANALNCHGIYYTNKNVMNALTKRYLRTRETKRTNRKQCKGIHMGPLDRYDFSKALQNLINNNIK